MDWNLLKIIGIIEEKKLYKLIVIKNKLTIKIVITLAKKKKNNKKKNNKKK